MCFILLIHDNVLQIMSYLLISIIRYIEVVYALVLVCHWSDTEKSVDIVRQ